MELQIVQNKIYEIRGYKVMLDFDLAEMYGVETKRLKEQVKRNLERFPPDFMFQLTKQEWELVAICDQFPTTIRHSYILPSVFTQEGVAMLSGVLRSPAAVQVNIFIMRAFVAMRQTLLMTPQEDIRLLQKEVTEIKEYMEECFADYNDINEDTRMKIELISESLAELQVDKKIRSKPRNPVGFTIKP